MIALEIIKINHVQIFASIIQKKDEDVKFCSVMCTKSDGTKIIVKGTTALKDYMVFKNKFILDFNYDF